MVDHEVICNLMRKLNKCASNIRRTIEKSKLFRLKKSRLRLENLTRWGTAFIQLVSFLRAILNGCFDEPNDKCPVDQIILETYIKVLKPVYLLNIGLQNNCETIANVIPKLLK